MSTRKLKEYTLETGEIIKVPPVSQVALTLQIKKEMPMPEPPLVTVDIAGQITQERNYADPNYDVALDRWNHIVLVQVMERAIRRIAIQQQLTDEQQGLVNEFRAAFSDEPGLPTNDKVLWLSQIACDDGDLTEVVKLASNMADPTEEGIKEAADSFPSDVQGS